MGATKKHNFGSGLGKRTSQDKLGKDEDHKGDPEECECEDLPIFPPVERPCIIALPTIFVDLVQPVVGHLTVSPKFTRECDDGDLIGSPEL